MYHRGPKGVYAKLKVWKQTRRARLSKYYLNENRVIIIGRSKRRWDDEIRVKVGKVYLFLRAAVEHVKFDVTLATRHAHHRAFKFLRGRMLYVYKAMWMCCMAVNIYLKFVYTFARIPNPPSVCVNVTSAMFTYYLNSPRLRLPTRSCTNRGCFEWIW